MLDSRFRTFRIVLSERLNLMVLRENPIGWELLVDDVLSDEIDQRIGLRVDVVLVEENLRVLENFAKSPGQRSDIVQQLFVVSERVESEPFRRVRREVFDFLERLRLDAQLLVKCFVGLLDLARLVEVAEVRSFDVEAHGGDRSLLLGEVREE